MFLVQDWGKTTLFKCLAAVDINCFSSNSHGLIAEMEAVINFLSHALQERNVLPFLVILQG